MNPIDTARLKSLNESAYKQRDFAGKRLEKANLSVISERSSFFDRLALFHSGTIAATITFAGVLHQNAHAGTRWRYVLFAGWIVLFGAMISCVVRNWQMQDEMFYKLAEQFERKEASRFKALRQCLVSGLPVIDQATGDMVDLDRSLEQNDASIRACSRRSEEHQKRAQTAAKWRKWSEHYAFALTGTGVLLVLIFAMKNFA